ncbi:aminoglycoside phosphotransferase family protein [Catenulispora sp. NF23]|uniref:Aminoglycoside phosphotransferase family protein n=1 Tax=Catenulispora pinistramenti TaxID=2705254 RepID=A0ABS5L785_9ACTN|nr:aminoglycoside phosphotransferase family protein [Catenulispora pinistramenti]MBS2537618.1 aminoglycoside phosphotransferase family protein [Catenulispora pinistramenti]MBS2554188.1 aminoglycoside phosphotransferase family protein [Catenulispora pinistramenti]
MGDFIYGQDLVRALLKDQHPDLADLELRDVPGGWGNQQFRLGPELAVRMPRGEEPSFQARLEQRWLPTFVDRLPLPAPMPVRVGEPSELFGYPWTVMRWVEGEPADQAPITRAESADALADFLAALHQPAPADAPVSERRVDGEATIERWLEVIEDREVAEAAREVWLKAVAAPKWRGEAMWLHTDLHPANVVVRDGLLAGVVDFGDLGSGDPAIDLSAAWILLPAGSVDRFFDVYQRADDADITRARGWAVLRAMTLIAIGRNGRLGKPGGKPTWEPAGYATLERALST